MQISPAESRIMDALWRRGPLGAEEVIADVAPAQGWTDSTVKTLISRLLHKKAIRSVREKGKGVRYETLVGRDDYLSHESRGFLDRMFGGELAPFVSHFASREPLSKADRDKLRALLTALDGEEDAKS